MTSDRELMQQALDALECMTAEGWLLHGPEGMDQAQTKCVSSIEALRARLAQPDPEPKCVMIVEVFGKDWRLDYMSLPVGKHKLYTHQYNYTAPPQREWQGLTADDIHDHWINAMWNTEGTRLPIPEFARAIEAKLKEKNT